MPYSDVKGVKLHYKVAGRGAPLVMIMGLGTDRIGWRFQESYFKKYYQVVTFDNRGVGKSDKPAGPYTTKMMADDTVGLMDHLGIKKANIMGVSMGGMIAQAIALNYPERVLKLVLGCTCACDDGDLNGPSAQCVSAIEAGKRGNMGSMISLTFNKRLYRFVFSLLMNIRRLSFRAEDLAGFKSQAMACATHNTLAELHFIKSPTLVIVGTHDRLLKPTSSRVIAGKIPGAKLERLQAGSHGFFIEMKDAFNAAVLEFLHSAHERVSTRPIYTRHDVKISRLNPVS